MIDFNLICTTSRNLEQEAIIEINSILTKLGDSAKIQKAEPSGIIIVKTNKEPELVIQELKEILKDDPWKIRYLKRVIPIEFTVSNINQLLIKLETGSMRDKSNASYNLNKLFFENQNKYDTIYRHRIIKIHEMTKSKYFSG